MANNNAIVSFFMVDITLNLRKIANQLSKTVALSANLPDNACLLVVRGMGSR